MWRHQNRKSESFGAVAQPGCRSTPKLSSKCNVGNLTNTAVPSSLGLRFALHPFVTLPLRTRSEAFIGVRGHLATRTASAQVAPVGPFIAPLDVTDGCARPAGRQGPRLHSSCSPRPTPLFILRFKHSTPLARPVARLFLIDPLLRQARSQRLDHSFAQLPSTSHSSASERNDTTKGTDYSPDSGEELPVLRVQYTSTTPGGAPR